MRKVAWIIIAIIVVVAILIVGSCFLAGSMEEYPTPEQVEKGRMAYGLLIVPLIGVEIYVLTRIFRKR